MIEIDDKQDSPLNKKLFVFKYFMIGVFSNFFYFLCVIGLKYLPKLIDKKKFIQNQYFRILISCLFVFILKMVDFNENVHNVAFYRLFLSMLMLNCLSLLYVKKYVLGIEIAH